MMRKSWFEWSNRVVALVVSIACLGCASQKARRHLEGVARGWCETIRASQVIPVYPLTEDLRPGDVFLVQTTVASQAEEYRRHGFLALDDHRARLAGLQFTNLYFDGYWKDEWGSTPHPISKRPNPGALTNSTSPANLLTDAPAPRVAFPTYTFAARSGLGLSLAIPIKGIPVGLNFLRSDRVNGSVTISDARTYAADDLELYLHLRRWSENPDVRRILSETVEKAGHRPVYLRVVSRVYLTGAVQVSLSRADATGASLSAGKAPPVPMMDAEGNVRTNYQALLSALSTQANPVTSLPDAGGAVKFVSVSESSVSLSESFDRMLAIGYLGFDVPVYPEGELGAPVPTFQRLKGTIPDPPRSKVGPLTLEQQRFRVHLGALKALGQSNPAKAIKVMEGVLMDLKVAEFSDARSVLPAAQIAVGKPEAERTFSALLDAFQDAALEYVTLASSQGIRYQRFDQAFVRAYDRKDNQP